LLSAVLCGCGGDCRLTDNYVVRVRCDGVYDVPAEHYPILAGKLQATGGLRYVPRVKRVWWTERCILVEQAADTSARWWLISACRGGRLSWDDPQRGPLTRQQVDRIVETEGLDVRHGRSRTFE